MGICLDTEQNNAQEFQEGGSDTWKGAGQRRAGQSVVYPDTPPNGSFPMQNGSHVKFEPPKVPVIFVLGGPGSGKVTHCDNLMQDKRGLTHINMTDLLQQYAIGNDMQDFGQLSSKTVTEVLMLEMKMSPAAKTYLVSGYPRSMRDVVEYSDKIQVINGAVLISWRQKVLEKQIEYGAKLGHVVLSLAKMELNNFFKNVMPVADYFDQSDLLVTVNGERNPTEVYRDFRSSVLRILGTQQTPSTVTSGMAVGVGADGIPGEVVGIERAPTPANKLPNGMSQGIPNGGIPATKQAFNNAVNQVQPKEVNSEMRLAQQQPTTNRIPPVLFVIGGPGSNKPILVEKAIKQSRGWAHISIGTFLRTIAESDPKPGSEAYGIKQRLIEGEMISTPKVLNILKEKLSENSDATGVIIDGYPRDMNQVEEFANKFNQEPRMILLDCSKLQLSRKRYDDSVSAFRRRLELFRELSIPMLKSMDADNRLTIIDGDTDNPSVQEEFIRIATQQMKETLTSPNVRKPKPSNQNSDTTVHELEPMPGRILENGINTIPTISQQISNNNTNQNRNIVEQVSNFARITNGVALQNGGVAIANGVIANAHIGNGFIKTAANDAYTTATTNLVRQNQKITNMAAQRKETLKNMFADVDSYPIDSHM